MIYVDDFLTRTYWDPTPDVHGLGRNIPVDFDALSVEAEWAALRALHAMGLELMIFMTGQALDLNRADTQEAIAWLVAEGIPIAGHGYLHTAQDHADGYEPWAAWTLAALQRVGQRPPYWWRFPRHEAVNEAYITKLGFQLAPYDTYLDPAMNAAQSFEVLRGHEHARAWIHSCYAAKIHAATTHPAHAA